MFLYQKVNFEFPSRALSIVHYCHIWHILDCMCGVQKIDVYRVFFFCRVHRTSNKLLPHTLWSLFLFPNVFHLFVRFSVSLWLKLQLMFTPWHAFEYINKYLFRSSWFFRLLPHVYVPVLRSTSTILKGRGIVKIILKVIRLFRFKTRGSESFPDRLEI